MSQDFVSVPRELLQELDDLIYLITGHDSHPKMIRKYGEEFWIPLDKLRIPICKALAASVPPAGDLPERMDVPSRDEYELECYWAAAVEQAKAHNDCIDACAPIVTRLQAENAALQQRLNEADQRIDDLEQDKARLDSLEANYWDVRHHSTPIADTGDHSISVEIIGHWMDEPHERVIGENYNENLRAAIDQAMAADAYPPARPEYPELDAALAEEDWRMNPCKQGHRDVGACQGKAFCHTCDETITAETTQQAFDQWNATHPAAPQ